MLTGWPRPACTHVNPISGCSGVRYWSRFEAELSGVVPDCSLLRASRVHSWIAIEAWFRFNEVLLAGIVSWSRLSFLVFLIGSGGMVSVCECVCVWMCVFLVWSLDGSFFNWMGLLKVQMLTRRGQWKVLVWSVYVPHSMGSGLWVRVLSGATAG